MGTSVLGTANWDSEERKGKEAKTMLALESEASRKDRVEDRGRVTLKSSLGVQSGFMKINVPFPSYLPARPLGSRSHRQILLFSYFLFLVLGMEPLTNRF